MYHISFQTDFKIPIAFKTKDIDFLFRNNRLVLHTTKSLKHDNINKFCLLDLEKDMY